jgi:hypothetical protein
MVPKTLSVLRSIGPTAYATNLPHVRRGPPDVEYSAYDDEARLTEPNIHRHPTLPRTVRVKLIVGSEVKRTPRFGAKRRKLV